MKTFQEMAVGYIEWSKKNKLRETPSSKAFWEHRERLLHERVVPFAGGLGTEEQYRTVIEGLEAAIQEGHRNEDSYQERQEAMDAFMAVYSHYINARQVVSGAEDNEP